ncbi:hypothetical protein BJ742DRAFT_849164 [Cladochytrium replicatum]|nr:hypothetical protein BJ742DRAFT_849164 [Cladochytrium replicatum]
MSPTAYATPSNPRGRGDYYDDNAPDDQYLPNAHRRTESSCDDYEYYYASDSAVAQRRSVSYDDYNYAAPAATAPARRRPEPKKDPFSHKAVMKTGYLSVKKKVEVSNRFVVLCAPQTVDDIRALHRILFDEDPTEAMEDPRTTLYLGQITHAAVRGCPLLVIYPSEEKMRTDAPTFVQFLDVREIADEGRLNAACNFAVGLASRTEIRFTTSNSSDYQEWYKELRAAFQIVMKRVYSVTFIETLQYQGGAGADSSLPRDGTTTIGSVQQSTSGVTWDTNPRRTDSGGSTGGKGSKRSLSKSLNEYRP